MKDERSCLCVVSLVNVFLAAEPLLQLIVYRTKNDIMIKNYSALIFYQLTRIVTALATQKSDRSRHEFSFERGQKLIRGFLQFHLDRFLRPSLQREDLIFQPYIEVIVVMGLAPSAFTIVELDY